MLILRFRHCTTDRSSPRETRQEVGTQHTLRRIRTRSVFEFAIVVFALGYVLLCLSTLVISPSSSSYLKEIAVSGIAGRPQISADLPEKGTYYLNSSGEVVTNESSMIEVFDTKEKLVFGVPVAGLPVDFRIDSAGLYSVSLKNVDMQGSRLDVVEYAQNITYSSFYSYLYIPSRVIFMSGAIFFTAVFLFYVDRRSDEQKNRSRDFQNIVKISWSLRFFYFVFASLIGSLAFFIILTVIFGPLPYPVMIVSYIAGTSVMIVYFSKLYGIVGLILSVYGYKGLLIIGRIVRYLLVLLVIAYIPLIITPILMTPILTFVAIEIFIIVVVPITTLLVLLMPLMDPLDSVEDAKLALQEFLLAFRKNSRNSDFRYIKEASKSLASVIGENCIEVPSQDIQRSILSDLFAQARTPSAERSVPLIERIIAALNPYDSAALIGVLGLAIEEENRRPRPKFDRTMELITLVISIASVIAYLLK